MDKKGKHWRTEDLDCLRYWYLKVPASDLAVLLGRSTASLWAKACELKLYKPERRWMVGERSPNWKGDNAGYHAYHYRVYQLRGKPAGCDVCGNTDLSKRYEWANLTGRYEDPGDYKRMCQSCHRTYDGAASRKLSESQVEEIKRRYKPRVTTQVMLAAEFNVCRSIIQHVLYGQYKPKQS